MKSLQYILRGPQKHLHLVANIPLESSVSLPKVTTYFTNRSGLWPYTAVIQTKAITLQENHHYTHPCAGGFFEFALLSIAVLQSSAQAELRDEPN